MKKTALDVILDEPVDLQGLIDKLDFSEENIIVANREQSSLFLEASRYRVKKMRGRIQAEANLDVERANAGLFMRAKKRLNPKAGVTEAYIKDKVTINPSVQAAQQKYGKAEVYEEWAKQLLEAYRQRGHAIKTLAEILGAEANAQQRAMRKDLEVAGFESLKRAVRKKYPGRRED